MKKYLAILISSIILFSCVNSGMYNSSIGKQAEVKYNSDSEYTVTIDQSGYKVYDLEEDKEESIVVIPKSYRLNKTTKTDTIISSKKEIISIPIDPKKKDSLLFAMVKDKTKTDEQKNKELEKFIKSHKKEIEIFDTSYVKKEVIDTVFSEQNSEEISLENKLKEMEARLEALKNEGSKKEIKKEVKKTAKELYDIGYSDGFNQYDGTAELLIPLLSNLLLYIGFFISLITGLVFLSTKPKIKWERVLSEYKNDSNYRKGYRNGAFKIRKKNALFGLIPVGLILLLLIVVLVSVFAFLL